LFALRDDVLGASQLLSLLLVLLTEHLLRLPTCSQLWSTFELFAQLKGCLACDWALRMDVRGSYCFLLWKLLVVRDSFPGAKTFSVDEGFLKVSLRRSGALLLDSE